MNQFMICTHRVYHFMSFKRGKITVFTGFIFEHFHMLLPIHAKRHLLFPVCSIVCFDSHLKLIPGASCSLKTPSAVMSFARSDFFLLNQKAINL